MSLCGFEPQTSGFLSTDANLSNQFAKKDELPSYKTGVLTGLNYRLIPYKPYRTGKEEREKPYLKVLILSSPKAQSHH